MDKNGIVFMVTQVVKRMFVVGLCTVGLCFRVSGIYYHGNINKKKYFKKKIKSNDENL